MDQKTIIRNTASLFILLLCLAIAPALQAQSTQKVKKQKKVKAKTEKVVSSRDTVMKAADLSDMPRLKPDPAKHLAKPDKNKSQYSTEQKMMEQHLNRRKVKVKSKKEGQGR